MLKIIIKDLYSVMIQSLLLVFNKTTYSENVESVYLKDNYNLTLKK